LNNIQRWFLRQQKRQTSAASLYEVGHTLSIYPYILYRLRLFSLNILLLSICWAAEYYFLFFCMNPQDAAPIVGLRFVTITVYIVWWSFMEVLRIRIRHYYKEKKQKLIAQEIAHWMILGCLSCFAAIVLLFIVLYIYIASGNTIAIQPRLFSVYAMLIFLHTTSFILINIIRSSIYAVKRVSRPLISLVIAHIVGFILLLLTYRWLRSYALGCVYLTVTVINIVLSLYYMGRMDRIMHFLPSVFFAQESLASFPHFLSSLLQRHAVLLFVVGVALSSQMLLFYYLFYILHFLNDYNLLAIVFLTSLQFFQVFSWPTLFYLDFKRLDDSSNNGALSNRLGAGRFSGLSSINCAAKIAASGAQQGDEKLKSVTEIKKLLMQGLYRSALVVAVALWLISVWLVRIFYAEWLEISLFLLPIYIMQSYYGLRCMELFCRFRYWDIIVSSLVTVGAVLITLRHPPLLFGIGHVVPFHYYLVAIILLSRLPAFFSRFPAVFPPEKKVTSVIPFPHLMDNLVQHHCPAQALVLRFAKVIKGAQRRYINKQLLSWGMVAFITNEFLLFVPDFVNLNRAKLSVDGLLVSTTSGLVRKSFDCGICEDGAIAAAKLLEYLRGESLL
jgi:hypothetical protein